MLAASLIAGIDGLNAAVADPDIKDLPAIEKAATGQTVFFKAWCGSENINAYLEWVGQG